MSIRALKMSGTSAPERVVPPTGPRGLVESVAIGTHDSNVIMPVLFRTAMLVAAVLALNAMGGLIAGHADLSICKQYRGTLDALWITMLIVYVLVMALPFVPGIEIGLALMLLLGDCGVVLVYLGTQIALATSFMCGRRVPIPVLMALFRALNLTRAQRMLASLETTMPEQRLDCLARQMPSGWVGRLLKHRYVALAVVLNLPGNALLGGAGGLGLIAGASRVFSFPRYCLLMAVATSPLPIVLLIGGGTA